MTSHCFFREKNFFYFHWLLNNLKSDTCILVMYILLWFYGGVVVENSSEIVFKLVKSHEKWLDESKGEKSDCALILIPNPQSCPTENTCIEYFLRFYKKKTIVAPAFNVSVIIRHFESFFSIESLSLFIIIFLFLINWWFEHFRFQNFCFFKLCFIHYATRWRQRQTSQLSFLNSSCHCCRLVMLTLSLCCSQVSVEKPLNHSYQVNLSLWVLFTHMSLFLGVVSFVLFLFC